MADKYADGELTDGDQTGDSWAHAYRGAAGLQTAVDQAVAGNTIHITRTFTLAADIDIDQNNGAAGNMIRVLGYNYNSGSPLVDGTKAILNANSAADHCILVADKDYWYWANVEFKNSATAANVAVTNADEADFWTFLNCDSHNAATSGWGRGNGSSQAFKYTLFLFCQAYSNGGQAGFRNDELGNVYVGCTSRQNSGDGVVGRNVLAYGSVFAANSGFNVNARGGGALLVQCVIDGATGASGINSLQPVVLIGCRITNNNNDGIEGTGTAFDLYNYYASNSGTDVAIAEAFSELRGVDTRLTTGLQGYEDQANRLFNLVFGAAGHRTSVDMGGSNDMVFSRGLPSVPLIKSRG